MTDPDPIQLSYSGPTTDPALPVPALPDRGPAAAAGSVIVWTVATIVLVGLPGVAIILATLGPSSGFASLVVLTALVPLIAVAARGAWERIRGHVLQSRGRRRRSLPREGLALAIDWVGWAILALFFVGIPMVVVAWATGPTLFLPALVVLLLSVPLVGAAQRAVRGRRATAVLGYLEQAVRLNQPFDRVLSAAARGERGALRRRLEDLYLAVAGGMSLADALSVAVPEVPVRAVGMIAYAESTGQLPVALRRLLNEARHRASGDPAEGRAFAAWYPPVVLLVGGLVVTLLMVFVIPKFVQIFHDFRVPLPWLTRQVIDLALAVDWLAYLLPVALLVALAMLGNGLRRVFRGEQRSWLMLGPWDWVRWYAPVLGQSHRDRNLSDLCDAVADAVEQGFPLGEAVVRAQRLVLNSVLLRRVSAWAGALEQGMEPALAARAAVLPALLAGLATTGDPADAAGGLRFAARFYAARRGARQAALEAAYTPAVTIALGVVVATVALAMMLPIRDLIDRTGPYLVGP